jgi:hypothetical protein
MQTWGDVFTGGGPPMMKDSSPLHGVVKGKEVVNRRLEVRIA